jgi:hypothetical protein
MSVADEKTVNGADYAVSFRRPPPHTRFKPGQSGKGRHLTLQTPSRIANDAPQVDFPFLARRFILCD